MANNRLLCADGATRKTVIEGKCVLCNSIAKITTTDVSRREVFLCESEDCGHYEITSQAKSKLTGPNAHQAMKLKIQGKAKFGRENDKALEIYMDRPNLQLTARFKD